MTRNEWIAERYGKWLDIPEPRKGDEFPLAVAFFAKAADALEAAGCAPWQSAPPLPDAAAKVVEAAVEWLKIYDEGDYSGDDGRESRINLKHAVRAYKESVK